MGLEKGASAIMICSFATSQHFVRIVSHHKCRDGHSSLMKLKSQYINVDIFIHLCIRFQDCILGTVLVPTSAERQTSPGFCVGLSPPPTPLALTDSMVLSVCPLLAGRENLFM